MPDSLLIIAPLLVLAVVLLLGFAGCEFTHGALPTPDPTPTPTLTFRARVPTALTVLDPGVKFAWKRPGATMEETMTVTSFAADGADNVYEHPIPSPEAGSWLGRCEMAVRADSQVADGTSGDQPFDFDAIWQNVLLFQAEGSPLAPPFRVLSKGLNPA